MTPDAVGQLQVTLKSLDSKSFASETDRAELKATLEACLARIETPWETALRFSFSQPAMFACLKVCWDVDLFRKWVSAGQSPQTSAQISELVGVDHFLISRLLRHLASNNVIDQLYSDSFSLTPYSTALGNSDLGSTIAWLYDTSIPGFTNLPQFLKTGGYTNPTDSEHTNWHDLRGLSRFKDLSQRPEEMLHFQKVMTIRAANSAPWYDIYPMQSLSETARYGGTIVVDVGGGVGHDLAGFRAKAGEKLHWPGAFVLQELPLVVQKVSALEGIEVKAHDFFTEQPVKGALVYYLHKVLHDWDDANAIKILKRQVEAMEPGYSRILLHEMVIGQGSSAYETSQDMIMMVTLSSFERTETMWNELIAKCGLKTEKVWTLPGSADKIIEAIL